MMFLMLFECRSYSFLGAGIVTKKLFGADGGCSEQTENYKLSPNTGVNL